MLASSPSKKKTALVLGVLLLISLGLRLYGIQWDRGFAWSPHPDERAIMMKVEGGLSLSLPLDWKQLLSAEASPLNPRWFPYGSFPLYFLKLIAYLLSFVSASFATSELRLVGRAVSAFFDVGTVLLAYLLGARLYSRYLGLLAAAFVAFTVLHIQLSHFYTVDVMLVFFILLAFYSLVQVMKQADKGSAALTGLWLGLALATKVSVAPFFFCVVVGYALYCFTKEDSFSLRAFSKERLRRAITGFVITILIAGLTFAISEPYALIDRDTFLRDTVEQSEMVRRVRDYPYTRQYIGTTPYLYQIQQLTFWGMGPPLGIAAWMGLLFTTILAVTSRRKADLLLLSWVLPYFLLNGSFAVKFLRYLLPLTPFLCIMAARLLLSWADWAKEKGFLRSLAYVTIAIVILSSLLYSFAYASIYSRPHTAVQVSQWINANVPKGSHLVKEHWEEGLPNLGDYRQSELGLYDPDNAGKVTHIAQRLSEADYLVFFSNRLYGTIPRLPERYPITSKYYQLLFSGKLGFELAYVATSYPSLFGVTIVDDTFTRPHLPIPSELASYKPTAITINGGYADESFTVYDHPKVMLFKKVKPLSEAELRALLSVTTEGVPKLKTGLMLSEADAKANQAGGTWSEIFNRRSLPNQFPTLSWLLIVELIALAALPLSLSLFSSLPDRGYLLAKTLGILVVAYLSWLAASLHLLPFWRETIVLALGVLSLISAWFVLRRWKEIVSFFRAKWRLVVFGEGLFLVAFLLFYAIRLWNPDLWHPYRGGEKPMDFAYLNAVIKTTYLPPYDPWFSGGYLNYYYFGQFIIATLTKLVGIVPAVAFNLAVPLLFALTVSNAFSVAYNLAAVARKKEFLARLSPPPILAGLAASVFVAILGNLDGAVQLIQGLWVVLAKHNPFPAFDFWRSSRMMPPSFSITEFPFFTFLFADLHAHLIALPFTVLAVALALAIALRSNRSAQIEGVKSFADCLRENLPLSEMLLLLVLALSLATLRWSNSWDFPTYFLLASAAVLIGGYSSRGRVDGGLLGWAIVKIGVVYGLSVLLLLPFQRSYELFYSGVELSKERTPLHQYLAIHGLFVFLVLSYLACRFLHLKSVRRWAFRPWHIAWLVAAILLVSALFPLGFTSVAFLSLVLIFTIVVFIQEASIRDASNSHLFVLAAIGLALSLGLGVEFVTIKGDISRMNTVFKFYLQAWVLFGIASAYSLWWLFALWRGSEQTRLRFLLGRCLWSGGFVLLLAGSLIYPFAATPVRVRDRFNPLPPTNDGMAYMKEATYHDEKGKMELIWDYQAILWLQDNIQGSPVILEGVTPLYRWGSRISVYTGLPTVIGWEWHQKQQRWGYQWMVNARLEAVRAIYGEVAPDSTLSLLKKYEVSYIYIGPLERLYYPATGLAKFDRMVGKELEVAYQNEGVKIYKVLALDGD